MATLADTVAEQAEATNKRLDSIDKRMDSIDAQIAELVKNSVEANKRMDSIDAQIAELVKNSVEANKRMDSMDIRFDGIDAKLNRNRWECWGPEGTLCWNVSPGRGCYHCCGNGLAVAAHYGERRDCTDLAGC